MTIGFCAAAPAGTSQMATAAARQAFASENLPPASSDRAIVDTPLDAVRLSTPKRRRSQLSKASTDEPAFEPIRKLLFFSMVAVRRHPWATSNRGAEAVRKGGRTPILFLSGRDSCLRLNDVLRGPHIGACPRGFHGYWTLKLTLLSSLTAGFDNDVILIFAVVVTGPVTSHAKVPVVAAVLTTAGAIVSLKFTPSRAISIRTDSSVPRLWFHLMVCVVKTPQVTLVFGVVTVIVGTASVNGTSLTSPIVGSPAGLTRISACVVTVAGI